MTLTREELEIILYEKLEGRIISLPNPHLEGSIYDIIEDVLETIPKELFDKSNEDEKDNTRDS